MVQDVISDRCGWFHQHIWIRWAKRARSHPIEKLLSHKENSAALYHAYLISWASTQSDMIWCNQQEILLAIHLRYKAPYFFPTHLFFLFQFSLFWLWKYFITFFVFHSLSPLLVFLFKIVFYLLITIFLHYSFHSFYFPFFPFLLLSVFLK